LAGLLSKTCRAKKYFLDEYCCQGPAAGATEGDIMLKGGVGGLLQLVGNE